MKTNKLKTRDMITVVLMSLVNILIVAPLLGAFFGKKVMRKHLLKARTDELEVCA